MNKIWNVLVFRATLAFTLTVIFSALYNLATGYPQGDYLFLLEILGFIVFLEIIDNTLSYVSFHSRIIYQCAEFILMYVCFLIFSFLGHWFGFTFKKIIFFSSIFLIIFLLLHLYFHFLLKSESTDINNHLIKRKM